MEFVKTVYKDICFDIVNVNTVIAGSGAAGLNAADCLFDYGVKDICIVTEGIKSGTSRNTGSDKQTYYKLTLSGGEGDSVMEMAKTLFNGKCADGDLALCEAALSARSFLKLNALGVPFPQNSYGEFVGYKTDHDPRTRATSAGPYTSRLMTEALEAQIQSKCIKIFDNHQIVSIITENNEARGLLCLNTDESAGESRYRLFNCRNIIYATGGPAGMYEESVYPHSQHGASGIAFEAGVAGKNLTEWQYGLASKKPRWNVSGTYMQVLPRFVSLDGNSTEREFLNDYMEDYADVYEMLSLVFKKGYEWPFDIRKVNSSSYIDLCVYTEIFIKNRRVFLDFTKNTGGMEIDFNKLSEESRSYVQRAGACFGLPIERLIHMNKPAYDFYLDHGVDLKKDWLEISFCAQHNNGGLDVDMWWQSNIKGFFPVGEAAGSHGVYRPGGSALNAGQAGGVRAALYISESCKNDSGYLETEQFLKAAEKNMDLVSSVEKMKLVTDENISDKTAYYKSLMSKTGSAIRNINSIKELAEEIKQELELFTERIRIGKESDLRSLYRLRDNLICCYVYLSAMHDYAKKGGKSRGSALYNDSEGILPEGLSDIFRYLPDDEALDGQIQEVLYKNGELFFSWRAVRPIPEDDGFFENVWRGFRENRNVSLREDIGI